MTISYPLSLPSTKAVKFTMGFDSSVGLARSPFTFATQAQVNPGQMLTASFALPPMLRAEAAPWMAFLAALNGREGTFLAGFTGHATPLGIATGTPLVDGSGNTAMARTLATKGWTAGVTGILKAGDFIQLGSGSSSRLHMVVRDASSDGAGKAVLDIWPSLRSAPAANAAIVVNGAKGVFRLSDNKRTVEKDLLSYGVDFNCEEAF